MFIDWTYIVLVLPAVIFAMICSARVQSTFKKYSSVPTASGMTGAQAAQAVLDANGVTGVRIEHVPGNLTDHYDPRTNVIRLSDNVINGTSAAAVGVAALASATKSQSVKSVSCPTADIIGVSAA